MSVATSGIPANGHSGGPSMSADGRYVAFVSSATNLGPGDTSASSDVFVHDRRSGATTRMSVMSDGTGASAHSLSAAISGDGRHVAFVSWALNLVPPGYEANLDYDIFVHDRETGATTRSSNGLGGTEGDQDSGMWGLAISAEGRFVAFQSFASNLVPGDTNGTSDIFVDDRLSGTVTRVSVATGGAPSGEAFLPSISADGRYVAFVSYASLVPGEANGLLDVFVHDRQDGSTTRVSADSSGGEANGDSVSGSASLSSDGRFVVFASDAFDLVDGDTNGSRDVFLHDRQTATTTLMSVDSAGLQGNFDSASGITGPAISPEGRYVAFHSLASNLVPGDTNGVEDIFVHDRESGTTTRMSFGWDETPANGPCVFPRISAGARFVAFQSPASNLVPGDWGSISDVFVRDARVTGFDSLCHPGTSEVIECPCSNPPIATGRGCDNSSSTGGAVLSASGVAYLSYESLVFSASGLKPEAVSVLLHGNSRFDSGLVYGQGVRCAVGPIKRLYIKTAFGGSFTAPDHAAFDPHVSERSAEVGDPIQPGQNRYYLVYYRDPVVLGGCPSSSTFNATQTVRVTWWL